MAVTWPSLPVTVDDIDDGWLTEALADGHGVPGARVVGIDTEPITAAVGLMGEVTRLSLTWDADDPALRTSVVAKLPSAVPDNRVLGQMLGLYEVEHRFYDDLAADVGLRTPEVWFTGADPEAGNYVVLLEDLGGCDRHDQLDGAPIPAAEAMIDALAAMHARFWGLGALAGHDWVPSGTGEALQPYADLVAGAWPAFDAAVAHLLDDEDRDLCRRFAEGFPRLAEMSIYHTPTLLHRDFRIDNALFDDGEPVVFDWSGAARGHGFYDLHYFIAGSLTTDDRRAHGDRLIERYLAGLAAAGVDLAGEDLADEHAVNALFCLTVPVMAGGDALNTRDEKGQRLIEDGLLRLFDHLHGMDLDRVLN